MSRVTGAVRWFFPPAGAVGVFARIFRLVIIGAVALGLLWLVWRFFFYNEAAREERANTVVAEEQGDATTNAAVAATETVIRTHETIRTIERQVDRGVRNVQQAEGAETPVSPDVDAAGRAALCMSRSYQRVNDCTGLQPASPPEPPGAVPVGNTWE